MLFLCFFIGNTITNYIDFKSNPDIYAQRSAPWYLYGAEPGLILFIVVTVIIAVIKIFLKKKMK